MSDTLLDQVLEHLRGEGLVRRPNEAGPLPPFWRNPADGTPGLGDKKGTEADAGVLVAGYLSGGIPPGAGQGYCRRRTIDLHIRAQAMPPLEELAAAIVQEFAPKQIGVRYDWMLGDLYVLESRLWSELQPLGSSVATGYHYRLSILIEHLV